LAVEIMIMSGVDDGLVLRLDDKDGQLVGDDWALTIGRREDNDICLRNDTFISRDHAILRKQGDQWFLEDCGSKNGTYIETPDADARVTTPVPIAPGQLFRIGRTWLRLQNTE